MLGIPILILALYACEGEKESQGTATNSPRATHTYFQLLDSTQTGIAFTNKVSDGHMFNILTYRNFYNGGGVAIGDVNNDELPDLYFTSNRDPNKLFLNRGDFQFEEITEGAGVAGTKAWNTGVTMADVNGDGWLDIYVCNSGDIEGADKENELFINQGLNDQGIPVFKEMAQAYRLNNAGYSTQAAFFDYDLDGDLDCYLLNNSFRDPGRIELFTSMRDQPDELGGDKLFRNDGDRFTDVTLQAGIYSSEIGFGLGAAIGDVNQDFLPDVYVSNDFWERDYLYINQGDGTFKEDLIHRINFCSVSSMGGDIADLNNDGYPEIFSTDMLAGDNERIKAYTSFDPYHLENMKYRANYHYQFVQNCLHLNDGKGQFQEIGLLSGVAATDWSWGALIFDFENDGRKDIFVSNGVAKDVMSMDFRDFLADNDVFRKAYLKEAADYQAFIDKMPSQPLPNYAFQNTGTLQFENVADRLGLAQPSFSNGAAYGDLDNDGDLDLVVNNVNMPAFVYRNEADKRLGNHYLKVRFEGEGKNPFGIGAQVDIEVGESRQTLQNFHARGFQSCVAPQLTFGLGAATQIDRLRVIWPDRREQVLTQVTADQTLVLKQAEASGRAAPAASADSPLFEDATPTLLVGDARHRENAYNDFDHEPLLLTLLSTEGPRIIRGDVNGDQLDDVVLLGAKDDEDKLFIQQPGGGLQRKASAAFRASRMFESTCGTFFDRDNDGDLDLMLGSGGNEYQRGKEFFILRYYENDGQGNFTIDNSNIPQVLGNFSTLEAADIDQDGDSDLFVGARMVPGNYGLPPRSFLLIQDQGKWIEATPPALAGIGMVSDAAWVDMDQDKDLDLVVVGDWMGVHVFINEQGLIREPQVVPNSEGWWTRVEPTDLDQDGDPDLVLGNWGLNTKFKASPARPLSMYVNDFDENQKSEFIINWYPPLEDQAYPFAPKPEITQQLPSLKKNVLTYQEYAGKTYESLFPQEIRSRSIPYRTTYLQTAILWNDQGLYTLQALPEEAQVAPVFGIAAGDVNADGRPDLWLGGNFYGLKPQVGRHDASRGVLLLNRGNRQFDFFSPHQAGIYVEGEVRDATFFTTDGQPWLLVVRNNASALSFRHTRNIPLQEGGTKGG